MNVWLAELWRAWRASLRRPGFLLLAAGVLALGIGACAVAFVLVEQVLLKPLPLSQPEQLMAAGKLRQGWPPRISTRQYAALQKLDGVQSIGLMAFATPTVNIMSRGMPQRAAVTYADPGLLPTLGLQPQLGRNFIAGEEDSRGAQIVMLSHDFWERQYAGDPSAIGQILKVEGTPHTIVGVLPEALSLSSYGGDIMLPADLGPDTAGDQHLYIAVVRLAAGASPAAVNAQVAARLRAEAESSGTDPAHRARFGVLGYQASLHVGGALVLVLFQAGALLVLLIAVVNEANLLFLRALALQRDTAVRSALGARHWHLASPLLAEGLLVSLFGTGLGALLAMLGIAIVRSIIPPQLTGGELHLGVQTLLLMLLVSLLVTLGSALLGIWRARAMVSFNDLREGGRSGGTQQQGRLNRVLVTAQVMLTAVLLCACGIFLQQAWKNAHLQWGFDGANVATLALAPVQADYPDVRSVSALSQRLVERMRQLPGVLGAAASTSLPVNDFFGTFGTPAHAPGNEVITVLYRAVGDRKSVV